MERDLVALATDANRGVAIEAAALGRPIHLGLGPHAVAERFPVAAEGLQATSNAVTAIVSSASQERRSRLATESGQSRFELIGMSGATLAELDEWGCNRDGSPACFSREMPLQYRSRQQASSRESVIRAISDRIAR